MKRKISIALDGPAASGKSTTARLLAKKLSYLYIDTGAMYRAATLAALRAGVDMSDEKLVEICVKENRIRLRLEMGEQITLLNDENVNSQIRTPEINSVISVLSSYAGVRREMVAQQRELAKAGGVVMDGRDIGTVVLPDAELKVFMIATLQARAQRRLLELQKNGESVTYEEVEREIANRDKLDTSRSHSPLKKAEGARELDTSNLSIEQQVKIIYNWAREITMTPPDNPLSALSGA